MTSKRPMDRVPSVLALFLAVSCLAICGPQAAFCQSPPAVCPALVPAHPEKGARRYVLDRVEGQAVLASASKEMNLARLPGLCIALFEEKGERQAAAGATDEQGAFALTGVAPGRYTLVAARKGLRGIALPVELTAGAGKAGLLLRLRPEEDPGKSTASPVSDLGLRRELLQRLEQDQAIRQEWTKSGVDHPDPKVGERMAAIDAQDTARVKEIVKAHHGWPGPDLVGVDGTEAAFLLVQHADADPAFQKEMLPLVEKAVRAGDLRGSEYALLTDRVLVAEGKPQIYGTQMIVQGKALVPRPIADEAHLDKRRAEMGMEPFAEYLKELKDFYFPPEKDKP
jgi:hypothetical protein